MKNKFTRFIFRIKNHKDIIEWDKNNVKIIDNHEKFKKKTIVYRFLQQNLWNFGVGFLYFPYNLGQSWSPAIISPSNKPSQIEAIGKLIIFPKYFTGFRRKLEKMWSNWPLLVFQGLTIYFWIFENIIYSDPNHLQRSEIFYFEQSKYCGKIKNYIEPWMLPFESKMPEIVGGLGSTGRAHRFPQIPKPCWAGVEILWHPQI